MTSDNAIRLYVLVDKIGEKGKCPIAVVISKNKSIRDLRMEFEDQFNYPAEEQHWLINHRYVYDDLKIWEVVYKMNLYEKGYLAILFIMSIETRDELDIYFGSYVEEMYMDVKIEDRWRKPEKTIVIAEVVDQEILDNSGWKCSSCTFFNKPFVKFCDVCTSCRPEDFVMPDTFYFTEEDKKRLNKEAEIERLAREKEEEALKIQEQKKKDDLKKLKELYKEDLAFTTEVIECPICTDDIQPGEGVVLRNCLHTICKDCLKDYVINIDNPEVKCMVPDCIGSITHQEMQAILNEEEFERYQQLSLRTAEAQTKNTFHCKTPNCTAWVVFDDGVNFFECPICKKNSCILCGAIHEGQTCKEYQDELAIKARNDEAAKKDLAFLENLIAKGEAMKCPGCQIIIQKKSGCDWMQCNMCKIEICWATKGPRWGPKGRGDNTGGCQCRVKGKCHPKCGNCH